MEKHEKVIRVVEATYKGNKGCKTCGEKLFTMDIVACKNCGYEHDTPILFLCNCPICSTTSRDYTCILCGCKSTINHGPRKDKIK
jgi:predicted Zn-ribbon and HTH transcriptional regulator